MGSRKRYTAEEKIKILREMIEEGKSDSQIADRYEVPPNNIFKWRKQLFEGGSDPQRPRQRPSAEGKGRRAGNQGQAREK